MKKKIQQSMCVLGVIAILIASGAMFFLLYSQLSESMRAAVRRSAAYISVAVEEAGAEYLEQFSHIDTEGEEHRVTWIAADGTVLYDSEAGDLENHSDRPEFISALETGVGESTRPSDTLDKQTYYYAVRLSDGSVLRVAETINSVWAILGPASVYVLIILCGTILLAVLLSRTLTRRLIRPINDLNLDEPLSNETYAELMPLLQRLDTEKREQYDAEQMRREFSANVSHELKTPLQSISGYTEMIRSGIAKPEDVPRFIDRIYAESQRLMELIDDIIKISRLDEGGEMTMEPVALRKLCEDSAAHLRLKAQSKNVEIHTYGDEVWVLGVKNLLDEMVYNLCENAVKYNVDDGRVELIVQRGRDGVGPSIQVKDTGIGIPKDQQERVFERFYRVDKSHSKATGGTGLGLSIVKHAARYHGATITMDSDLGRGTTIQVTFPPEAEQTEVENEKE